MNVIDDSEFGFWNIILRRVFVATPIETEVKYTFYISSHDHVWCVYQQILQCFQCYTYVIWYRNETWFWDLNMFWVRCRFAFLVIALAKFETNGELLKRGKYILIYRAIWCQYFSICMTWRVQKYKCAISNIVDLLAISPSKCLNL